MCSVDLDEKEIEKHQKSEEHQLNRRRILDMKRREDQNRKSVAQIWLESLNSR